MSNILGISAFYHDSAACLVRDGDIIAAAQEERFTRKKHDPGFPSHAIRYCLKDEDLLADFAIVFYDKPLVKFERLMRPTGVCSKRSPVICRGHAVWLKEKLLLRNLLAKEFIALDPG